MDLALKVGGDKAGLLDGGVLGEEVDVGGCAVVHYLGVWDMYGFVLFVIYGLFIGFLLVLFLDLLLIDNLWLFGPGFIKII